MPELSLEVLRDMARNEAALPTSRRDAVMQWAYRIVQPTVGADRVSLEVLNQVFAELDQYPALRAEMEVLKNRHEALSAEHESLKATHGQLLSTHDALQMQVAENQKTIHTSRDAVLAALQSFREEQTARYAAAWYRRFWRWLRRLL